MHFHMTIYLVGLELLATLKTQPKHTFQWICLLFSWLNAVTSTIAMLGLFGPSKVDALLNSHECTEWLSLVEVSFNPL